jgi:two-component system response regulator YcbB
MKQFKREKEDVNHAAGFTQSIDKLFLQLGISGDKGSGDIIEIIYYLNKQKETRGTLQSDYKMLEVYKYLANKYEKTFDKSANNTAIEQRIRRTIFRALENISNMGIEDYGNEIFTRYSNTLFEFKEVRTQMDFIRGRSYEKGTINVRKFIEGAMALSKQQL